MPKPETNNKPTRSKQWYWKNKKKSNAISKKYYEDHKEEILEERSKRYHDNPEHFLAISRKSQKKHKEKYKKVKRKYYLKNKKKLNAASKEHHRKHVEKLHEFENYLLKLDIPLIVEMAKEEIACNMGYIDPSKKVSCWRYAMKQTRDRKKQLELYEQVINKITTHINFNHDKKGSIRS